MSDLNPPSQTPEHRRRALMSFTPHQAHEEAESWLVSYADMMTLLVGFFVILLSFSTLDQEKFDEMRKIVTTQFGGSYQIPYGELKDRIREAMAKQGLGDQFVIKQTSQGVEISFQGAVFFATGSADIKPEGTKLLEELVPVIDREAKNFHITVEGHTDDVPIQSSLFHNNWELSSIRACRVLDSFLGRGFTSDKLTALGYGETRPVVPNRDAQGNPIVSNQSQNRRVVIKVFHPDEAMTGAPAAASTSAPPPEEPVQK